jgi:hypothetical protein
MGSRRGIAALATLSLGGTLAMASPAQAGDNDIVLARLGKVTTSGGVPSAVIGQNLEFRALVSELGIVLAPRLLTPADTLGFGGFQFTADVGYTTITNTATYWRTFQNVTGPDGSSHSGTLPTVGLFVRKGMWFPIPSIEFGGGIVHLMDSQMFAAQGYAKLAIHEGYDGLPLPSLAVRGAASRLMGQHDLDLTTASFDVSISKHVGIGGTWSIDPFGGWNLLWIVPRSQVIDATPNIDPLKPGNQDDSKLNFVFKDQADIIRQRIFFGAKLQYYLFQITLEADFALAGSSVDDRAGTTLPCTVNDTTTSCDSTDIAKLQKTYLVSLGFDF